MGEAERRETSGPGAVARAFHESTKHSFQTVRRRGHSLDWDNKPNPAIKLRPSHASPAAGRLRSRTSRASGMPALTSVLLVLFSGVLATIVAAKLLTLFYLALASGVLTVHDASFL